MHTLFIVPAFSDQAGQCRIVARAGRMTDCLTSYRLIPEQWREVGLMDSAGNVRCIELEFAALRHEAPLAAGTRWIFENGVIVD